MASLFTVGRERLWGLMVLAPLVAGCAGKDTLRVERWGILPPGASEPHPIQLPADLGEYLPSRDSTYRLVTSVPVPEAWRGQPVTLALPYFLGSTELDANGSPALPESREPYEVHRGTGTQLWGIPPEATSSETLALELTVHHRWAPSAWFNTVPRLSKGPYGDRTSRTVRDLNEVFNQAGLWILLTIGFTSTLLFWSNRRQNGDYGWIAIETLPLGYFFAFHLGVTQALFGQLETAVLSFIAVTSIVAGDLAMRVEFGLPLNRRFLAGVWLTGTVAAVALSNPFWGARVLGPLTLVLIGLVLADFYRALWDGYRQDPSHPTLRIRFAGTVAFTILVGPTVFQWVGLPEPLEGVRTVGLGLILFSLSIFAALTRRHLLAKQLSEARYEEIQQLNVELRRTIEERSRQLAEALERLDQPASEPEVAGSSGPGGRAP